MNSHPQTNVIGKKDSFNFVAIKSAYKISLQVAFKFDPCQSDHGHDSGRGKTCNYVTNKT